MNDTLAPGQARAAREEVAKRATDYAATMLADQPCEPFVAACLTARERLVFGRGETQFRAILDACDEDSCAASAIATAYEGEWETIPRGNGAVLSRLTITNLSGYAIAWVFR